MPKDAPPDNEIARLLKVVIDHFDREDKGVRDRQIKVWRRLKLLWDNLQHAYYSEVAHDWRIPTVDEEDDQAYYDKPVNVFRAYLESIIAALSITIPPITCYPDDADNPLDVTTAKAGDKIAALIFRHNDAPLLWLHALFVYCTEGMIACYSYPKEDKKYGTYEEEKTETQQKIHVIQTCPSCGGQISDNTVEEPMPEETPYGMDQVCPNCNNIVTPQMTEQVMPETVVVGREIKSKSRVMMEIFGGLHVKIPIWARKQEDCPYLIYSYETHFSNVIEKYNWIREKLPRDNTLPSGVGYDTYEQWGRLSPQYHGEYPDNNVTVRNCWLRPSAFNVLQEEETTKIRELYPDGAKVVVVNEVIADAENEDLDDVWTLSYNPLSDHIHHDPLGLLLTSIQEITNDIISLTLQTVEHGIPQTFVDPRVIDFKSYRNSEVIPGGIYPAKAQTGKPLGDGFYEVSMATLSQEVLPFANKVQELGQLVSGALPSLFGGQIEGSRTASEYSMSRAQALQRLQTVWKMLTMWWKNVFGKVIPLYITEMKDDERNVTKDEFGNFVNVFIRKAETEGKIGRVELEANENLPITWSQQKDVIMQLFEINNEMISATLGTPENLPYLKKAIGLTDYVIPGEDDRNKQHEEILKLINSNPIIMPGEMDPMTGMEGPEQRIPSVEVDPDLDNHALEADVCRRWLISDAGRLCKVENPDGYENVLLHMKMHRDIDMQMQMQAQMMMAQASPSGVGPAGAKEENPTKTPPIKGEGNVNTVA